MVLGCRWSILCSSSFRFIEALPFLSNRCLSSKVVFATYKTQKFLEENVELNFSPLSRHTVHSALLNCSSDLVALSFFLWSAKQPNYFHDRIVCEHMVGVVSRLVEQHKTVEAVVSELEKIGCSTKAKTFLLLLRICWQGGMDGLVLDVFEQMCCSGYTPNTLAHNAVMDVLFKTGSVDVALKVLKQMELPNFLTFNIALRNLCNLKDLFLIGDAFRMMLRMGYNPSIETFEMVLNCFCKMGKLDEAYQVLGLMIAFGVPVSENIWSILIDGFCRLCRLDIAVELLGKMVGTGCSPTVVTYTHLVRGLLKSHMVSDAFVILHIMESRGCSLDLVLCNVLIDCLAKVGKYDDAIDVFVDMLKRKISPDSYTFCSLLSAISLSGRFSCLPKLVRGLVIEADVKLCNSLLSYFCKAGFPCIAVKLYEEMLDRGLAPDEYTFAGLLSGLCRSKRIDQAINLYHWIVMNYPTQDPHIHTIVIDGLIKAGKFHLAIRMFRKAISDGYPLDVQSYTTAIHGLFLGRRAGEVCSLYKQMKEVGIAPNAYTYNVMLSGFCKEKDVKMIRWILQEMISARMELNCYNLFRLSSFLSRSHHSHSVIGLLLEMKNLGLTPAKAMHISNRQVERVKVDEESYSFFEGIVGKNQFDETSFPEDHFDVAASVG